MKCGAPELKAESDNLSPKSCDKASYRPDSAPSNPFPSHRNKAVAFHIDFELYKRFQDKCDADGVTRSNCIRELIAGYVSD